MKLKQIIFKILLILLNYLGYVLMFLGAVLFIFSIPKALGFFIGLFTGGFFYNLGRLSIELPLLILYICIFYSGKKLTSLRLPNQYTRLSSKIENTNKTVLQRLKDGNLVSKEDILKELQKYFIDSKRTESDSQDEKSTKSVFQSLKDGEHVSKENVIKELEKYIDKKKDEPGI